MSLVKYNSNRFRPISFNNPFDKFFDDNFAGHATNQSSFIPQVDIAETKEAFEVQFIVPGVEKDAFNIDLQNGQLTVSGERKLNEDKTEKNFKSVESYYGSFKRSFYLPDNITEESVSASYENGILNISIPKDEKKVAKQTVQVK